MTELNNMTIVDRVVERLKLQPIGDLITEEDLHDIVKQAIPKTFFEPRYVKTGSGYHEKTEAKPPLIVEIMSELLRGSAEKMVADWLAENAGVVTEHFGKVFDAGLLHYVEQIRERQATSIVREAMNKWVMEINNERVRVGASMLSPII